MCPRWCWWACLPGFGGCVCLAGPFSIFVSLHLCPAFGGFTTLVLHCSPLYSFVSRSGVHLLLSPGPSCCLAVGWAGMGDFGSYVFVALFAGLYTTHLLFRIWALIRLFPHLSSCWCIPSIPTEVWNVDMFNLLLLTFSQALSVPDCEDASALQLTRNHQVPSFPGGPGGNPHPAMTVTNVVFDEATRGPEIWSGSLRCHLVSLLPWKKWGNCQLNMFIVLHRFESIRGSFAFLIYVKETLHCSDPRWKPDSTGIWTFKQIAESFLLYGAKKFYSPGVLDLDWKAFYGSKGYLIRKCSWIMIHLIWAILLAMCTVFASNPRRCTRPFDSVCWSLGHCSWWMPRNSE